MNTLCVEVAREIAAPVSRVYAILADYHVGHARILPHPPFVSLRVLKGGHGAGTLIEVKLQLFGRVRTLEGLVTERQPGRLLVQQYGETGLVTSFCVQPRAVDGRSLVTITTEMPAHGSLLGKIERWIANAILRPVYLKELENLARSAQG